MRDINAAPLFPKPVVFPDVDEAVLAREDEAPATHRPPAGVGIWQSYLGRTLGPYGATCAQAAS